MTTMSHHLEDKDKGNVKHRVAIIGAGVAGVATAGALKDYGIEFVVFDKNGRPGGLWADNYPGTKGKPLLVN